MAAAGTVRGVSGVLYAEGDRHHPDEPHPHHRGAGSEHLTAGRFSAAVRDVPRGKGVCPQLPAGPRKPAAGRGGGSRKYE